jgi:hypothetical protein
VRVRVKNPQDLGAAIVFFAIGIAGLYFGQELERGTTAKMGTGYFPFILSWLILAVGAVLLVRSLSTDGPAVERVQWRPITFIVGGVLLFGYLLQWVGLLVSAVAITIVAAYARRNVSLSENIWLGAGLAVFTAAVFIYALNQPLPLWWGSQ